MLKIISIHIPKTGGRSFYRILQWAYGDKIGLPKNKEKHVFNGKFAEKSIDPEKEEVLHGHFHFRHIEDIYKSYNPKIIIWLRDPVDRVISNYYYNINMNFEKPWKKQSEKRKELTLLEFASRPKRRNVMSKAIEGLDIKDVFFVGIMERFEKDLRNLGSKLGWPSDIPQVFENNGTKYYNNPGIPTVLNKITKEMKMNIRELNIDDVNLYNIFARR